ncbi:MAG: type IIA DNA topoisomerase subunit B [Bifidobacteriaceae bacterium]|jgi:DNA gyrase subunit B|nr:type IIA DNA topoisomerase subunit B [Bifidobacteriaceae bacterium]
MTNSDKTPNNSEENNEILNESVTHIEAPDADYGAANIQVLEGLEAVRLRPGMYIGSTGPRGLHHLVYEVVDNSVDEALAGFATHIDIELQSDGGVRVTDNGRGIPVDKMDSGLSALDTVFTVLHAGGKFGGGGYAVSGGLHGVGISVVNALSTRVTAEVKRQGYVWKQEFIDGEASGELQQGEKIDEDITGTTIVFYADDKIFETVEYDFETLRTRFRQTAFLNKGITITITDSRKTFDSEDSSELTEAQNAEIKNGERPLNLLHVNKAGDLTVMYRYVSGLIDYVKTLNKTKKIEHLHPTIIYFEGDYLVDVIDDNGNPVLDENGKQSKQTTMTYELALQWTGSYNEQIWSFANTITTTEGGTHEEGFRTALTSAINRYARDKGLFKDKDENLQGEDVREGLTAVLSIKLTNPQFEGQTKTKLGNTEARTFVQKSFYERFTEWLGENPDEAKIIVKKGQNAAQGRIAAKRAKEATQRKSVFESAGMPDKLRDCQTKDAALAEIFIVEGDSAGGSAVQGRNPFNQAIMPLRGKILNIEKVSPARALSSETIQTLISAIGTGIGPNFDAEKARYHKIVLMADADVDGAHICTLLLTFLFRYMKPLIELGYVYLAQPPLYRIKWSTHPHDYVYSDEGRDEALAAGEQSGWKLPKEGVQRYKGLGEMNYQELWETTMAPETRTLLQVNLEDAAAADLTFSMLMGEDVEARRKFISHNAKDVRFLDI